MTFYLLHGEKGVVCSICLYLVFPVISFYVLQGDKGVIMICLYLAFGVSCLSTDRKVRKGAVLTYVRTWFSLHHGFLLIAR